MNQQFDLRTEILIVGAGFGGLGLAIKLKRRGDEDFVIIDRADDVGGTWRDNHYPGAACDVPSHLYSFSFRLKTDWSRIYSPGAEIQQYLHDCVAGEGLAPHLQLGADMTDARWDADSQHWVVTTSRGVIVAKYLITGTGHLADAHYPDIDGLDTFAGAKFHSAAWDHSVSLEGKRIGVVGTGASAIQIVPEMVKTGSEVVVFQRTPSYMVPRYDRDYTEGEKRMYARNPDLVEALRRDLFWTGENNFAQRRAVPQFLDAARSLALTHLAEQVADPQLRERLTPSYEPGCKRILISNDFYPALQQPHVALEASALDHVNGSTAYAASGETYEVDALVFATGFEATQPPFAEVVTGRTGVTLAEHWNTGMQAFDSTAVHGFPNLFLINGPNTSLGHNSIVYIIESQIEYLLGMIDHCREDDIAVIEPTREAEDAYVDRIQAQARGTVWIDGGCQSWYVDPRSGKLTLIWPDSGFAFRHENHEFHTDGYELVSAGAAAGAGASLVGGKA